MRKYGMLVCIKFLPKNGVFTSNIIKYLDCQLDKCGRTCVVCDQLKKCPHARTSHTYFKVFSHAHVRARTHLRNPSFANMYIIPFKNNAFPERKYAMKSMQVNSISCYWSLLISSPKQSGKIALFIHTPFLPSSSLNEYHLHSITSKKITL